ncbi:hypothetical protein [Streptomyces sp. NPDC005485]|uniref:hypothetical protein n=1 Tax=Streptomyces sp. NPDC005485 TaxID=3155591 RepID=UPI0033AF604A
MTPRQPATVPTDDLPTVIRKWAEDRSVYLLPALATADEQHTVHLEPEDMTIDAYCGLADALGVKVVYQNIERFEADSFAQVVLTATAGDEEEQSPDMLLDEASLRQYKSLRAQARPHDGRTLGVELCFVHHGVAHLWETTAPWYDDLDAGLQDLLALKEHAKEERRNQTEDPAAEEARQTAMTQQLRQLPEFRSARTATDRCEIAERLFPEPDDEDYHHSRRVRRVLADAHAAVQRDSKTVYEDYENGLDQLADELISSGLLDLTHGAAPRRIKTADFLTARSGGYPPPVRTVTLLMDRLKNSKLPTQDILPL